MFRGAVDGAQIGWFAPTFTILRDQWRNLKRATSQAWVEKSETEHRIELPGGGSITCRSLDDPDSARGPGWDGIVMDEAAFCTPDAWQLVLRPALADRGGWAMFLSTPNGHNWFKELFDRGAGGESGWESWQRPTSDNPLVPPRELAAALRDMGPRAFAQEHEAQFMEVEGAVFPSSYFPQSVWFDGWPDGIMFRVLACDPSLGKTDKSDFSAIVSLGLDTTTGIMYADANLERRPPSQIVRDVYRIASEFGPVQSVAIEANQFQAVLASHVIEYSRSGGMALPVHPVIHHSRQPKQTRIIGTLDPYLSRQEIRFRNTHGGRMLVDQLQRFPQAKYDDGPDALQMAVREMQRVFHGVGIPGEPERVVT